MTLEELRQKAKTLPVLPGIYMMKDSLGNIIYVGKSKALKKRVGSYFNGSVKENQKIKRLVANIDSFEYTLTDTELDALLLECRLIKKIKPVYNSLLKNDKKYRFISIHQDAELPRAEVAYEREEEGVFFGPYDIPYRLTVGVEALNAFYKLPTCKKTMPKKDCLAYRMEKCMGPCENEEEIRLAYSSRLDEAIQFLEGKNDEVVVYYETLMRAAAEKLDFEKAAKYREYLSVLKMIALRKEAVQFSLDNKKGIALIKLPDKGLKLYLLSGTQIVYSKCFKQMVLPLNNRQKERLVHAILTAGSSHFQKVYERRRHLAKEEVDEALITYYYLKTKGDCCFKWFDAAPFDESKKSELAAFVEEAVFK